MQHGVQCHLLFIDHHQRHLALTFHFWGWRVPHEQLLSIGQGRIRREQLLVRANVVCGASIHPLLARVWSYQVHLRHDGAQAHVIRLFHVGLGRLLPFSLGLLSLAISCGIPLLVVNVSLARNDIFLGNTTLEPVGFFPLWLNFFEYSMTVALTICWFLDFFSEPLLTSSFPSNPQG